MPISIASLAIDLGLNIGQLGPQMSAVKQSFSGLERQLSGFGKAAQGIFSSFGLASKLSLAGVAVGLTGLTKSSIELADRLNDLSKQTGVSTETLSVLRFAAQQSGSNLDSVAGALGKLSKSAFEAITGNKELSHLFRGLNIELKSADGALRPAEALFRDVAGALAGVSDTTTRAAVAQKLLGKSGAEQIPVLLEIAANWEKYNAIVEKSGAKVTKEMAAQADELNDQLGEMKLGLEGIGGALARVVLPPANAFLRWLTDLGRMDTSDLDAILQADRMTQMQARWRMQPAPQFQGGFGKLPQPTAWPITTGPVKPFDLGLGGLDAGAKKLQGILEQMKLFEAATPFRESLTGIGEVTEEQFRSLLEASIEFGRVLKDLDPGLVSLREGFLSTFGTPTQKAAAEIAQLDALLKQGAISSGEHADAVRKVGEQYGLLAPQLAAAKNEAAEFGASLHRSLMQVLTTGRGFSGLLDTILSQLAELAFSSIFKELFGGLEKKGGFLGGLGSFLTGLFGGGFQHGGMAPLGRLSVVGERGPEPILPTARGTFVWPSAPALAAGAGANITIQNFIDARGADLGVEQRLRAMIESYRPQLAADAVRLQYEISRRTLR